MDEMSCSQVVLNLMNVEQDDGSVQIGAKPNEWRARWMSLCPQEVGAKLKEWGAGWESLL